MKKVAKFLAICFGILGIAYIACAIELTDWDEFY